MVSHCMSKAQERKEKRKEKKVYSQDGVGPKHDAKLNKPKVKKAWALGGVEVGKGKGGRASQRHVFFFLLFIFLLCLCFLLLLLLLPFLVKSWLGGLIGLDGVQSFSFRCFCLLLSVWLKLNFFLLFFLLFFLHGAFGSAGKRFVCVD